MASYEEKKASSDNVHATAAIPVLQLYDPSKETRMTRLGLNMESFKRAPGLTHIPDGMTAADFEKDGVVLQKTMKPRHLQMIAVGGSIGTGLFIGTGSALRRGGPLGILIAWIVMGAMLLMTMQAMGELAIVYPVSGAFYTLTHRFVDPSWGFAMGWNYVIQWAIVLPLELTAAGITIEFWHVDVSVGVWITVFMVLMIFLTVLGTAGFAEEEFLSSCLKLFVVVLFLFIAVVCNAGGGPSSGQYSEYVGGRFWKSPGPLANGFKGVCRVFVTAAFSFAGTELVGLAATETPEPEKTLPSAIKGTFWRITIIYLLSILMIGLLVPYDDPNLSGGGSYDANYSPFVIVITRAGIKGIDHLINVTITIAILSIGLSCIYAGSRTLTALAEQGYAPKIFTYIDKAGRPTYSLIAILACGPLAYVNLASDGGLVFDWLLALSGLSTLFTWLSINIAHIRFRAAWKYNGRTIEELPYRAHFGVAGSWIASALIVLVIIAQIYVAIWPLKGEGPGSAETFFMACLAIPVLMVCYIGGLVWKAKTSDGFDWRRAGPRKISEIDIDTGRRPFPPIEQLRQMRADRAAQPFVKRMWNLFF